MSSEYPDYLTTERNSDQTITNMLNCNCLSAVRMTKIVLQLRMRDKGGFIINISSAAGILPIAFFAVYGATKSFVNSFSENIESELKGSNVTVENVAPFLVSTNMSKVRPSLFVPSPRRYASGVLRRLGTCSFTHGCLMHELQGWLIGLLPRAVVERLVYSANAQTRQRAIRKAEKRQ